LTPEQIADLLDRYLSKLDALVQTYELYKVRLGPDCDLLMCCLMRVCCWQVDVIRDCVIVAANLYQTQSDHVRRVCRFALGAIQAAEETLLIPKQPERGSLQIRCGYVV
jgi:hypothetical protein